ncbi:sodium/proline symporter [Thalassotalea castellviae]|uniref:Sodium/proline symporter n=1 Tax=Thalassotalea castellviae TaxID=3075612 RepID=A0ABU3A4F9_9GAMM|nr:sodium/proline symporter [Thalassotalea sp. W431]MDT0604785.1 sodium/proline symporter [Thalassotalea sp. W431]
MDYQTTVLITLIIYKIVLISIGIWSNKRTTNTDEYFIGGRELGPWVAAISAAASASSAWSLLGMSGAAYLLGLSAIWIVPSVVLGYSFNWLWLAPRMQKKAKQQKSVTLSDFIAQGRSHSKAILWLCSLCIVFSFAFYIAAQFQAAGNMFSDTFAMSANNSIMLGTVIILIYTLLGGFWAVSITDTLQGLLMVATAIMLPTAAIYAIGGPIELWQQMQLVFNETQLTWFGEHQGIYALFFVLGTFGIGLGNPGQPHVVNRLMALKDEKAVKQGKYIGIGWSVIIFISMLLVGWSAKVLLATPVTGEQALVTLSQQVFHPVLAGIVVAATLSAIMSTADSQLLVAASAISYDVSSQKSRQNLVLSRVTVIVMCGVAMCLAIFAPEDIFTRVLFAWNALGAAFGPLVIIILMGRIISGKFTFLAILIGFFTTVIFSFFPPPPGDVLERVLPFVLAFIIAWLGSTKEVNPLVTKR